MSQENARIILQMLARARDDRGALTEILDENVRWELGGLYFLDSPAVSYGPDSVREFFERWTAPFEEWGYELLELIDAGDAIVVQIRQWGRGKGSGATVDQTFWQVWTFRNGKVVSGTHHLDRESALEAARPTD